MPLEVTSTRIQPIDDDNGQLFAFASIVLDEEFAVHNLRIVKADSKLIVAMPNEEHKGEYRDVAHPITNACRERIRNAVLKAYDEHPDVERSIEDEINVS